ncbi:YadA-like family protein [Serratia symbiotica]|uniref:YadA-like family protein n=1 Tax=Serratia symbiotica TaxID=138074 RepID=UPI0033142618
MARRDGDAATLKSANDYTNWRVDTLNIDTADTLRQSQTYTDTRVSESLNYTDSKFSPLNTRIGRAEKRLRAGIAGVAAIASIPYMASNRFSYGVAVGNYQNANALAGGIQYKTSPNTTIRLNVSLD